MIPTAELHFFTLFLAEGLVSVSPVKSTSFIGTNAPVVGSKTYVAGGHGTNKAGNVALLTLFAVIDFITNLEQDGG